MALDPRGDVRWSMGLGANGRAQRRALAVDVAGNVRVAGAFRDDDVLEGLDALHARARTDAYVVRDDRIGPAMDGHTFGDVGDDAAIAVAARPCGGLVVAGFDAGTVDLGGVSVSSLGTDGFVAAWKD